MTSAGTLHNSARACSCVILRDTALQSDSRQRTFLRNVPTFDVIPLSAIPLNHTGIDNRLESLVELVNELTIALICHSCNKSFSHNKYSNFKNVVMKFWLFFNFI